MEIGVPPREGRYACAGSRDEVIVDDIGVALPSAVACDVAAATSPVIHDLTQCQYPEYVNSL